MEPPFTGCPGDVVQHVREAHRSSKGCRSAGGARGEGGHEKRTEGQNSEHQQDGENGWLKRKKKVKYTRLSHRKSSQDHERCGLTSSPTTTEDLEDEDLL